MNMNLIITQVSEKYNITPDTLRYFEIGKFIPKLIAEDIK